jgi:6-phosphofructokinase 1
MDKQIKKIAILTSGGDAPGMNAAVRALARTALYHGVEVFGVRRGYQGLIEGDIFKMKTTDVANIMQRGGTILKTARSKEFRTPEGRKKAYEQLQQHGIDALALIGGDGTFSGAVAFFNEFTIPAIGLPGTIDKDLAGTDLTIGFDTAVNTAVEAIDKIRDTAEAHDRLFIVEVMGRDAGYIALHSGIACGAEEILIPETKTDIEAILQNIDRDNRRKKTVRIIVVAEGDEFGGSSALLHTIQNRFPELDVRATVLGHIQRGGAPSCADRVLSSRLGYAAIEALLKGTSQVMVGIINDEIVFTPFAQAVKENSKINDDMLQMIKVLSA